MSPRNLHLGQFGAKREEEELRAGKRETVLITSPEPLGEASSGGRLFISWTI